MPRLATSIALAAWIGFLCVFSVELVADAVWPNLAAGVSAASWPPSVSAMFDDTLRLIAPLSMPVELGLAALCLAIVGLLGRALALLHSPARGGVARAERATLTAIAAVAVLALGAYGTKLPLLPVDFDGGFIWLAFGLSIAAVAFDRLVAIESEEDDAEAFEAGIAAIAQGLACQTRLYTPSIGDSGTSGR